MNPRLKQAFERAALLPDAEQAELAESILDLLDDEDVADDAAWDARFARSPESLARLVEEGVSEERAGGTRPLHLPDR
jgi:hypothetical protein